MTSQETAHRVERDSMGEVHVPRDALFGAQTRRALDNFPISDLRFQRRFIQALGAIKLEAAVVNHELGLLDEELKEAIVEAAEEVVEGRRSAMIRRRPLPLTAVGRSTGGLGSGDPSGEVRSDPPSFLRVHPSPPGRSAAGTA